MARLLGISLRDLRMDEVEFSVLFYTEDTEIEGNILASGNDAEDKEAEEEVRRQIARGNMYAWCSVEVSAKWSIFSGRALLGCCSYVSEEDARKSVEEDGLKEQALDDLNRTLVATVDALNPLLDVSDDGDEERG